MKKKIIYILLLLFCSLILTACKNSNEDTLSRRGYQIGTEVVDTAEGFCDGYMDAETANNKIVPLSLDAEREDAELYEYIVAIIGDICSSGKEDDTLIEEDIDRLRGYIGYSSENQD